MLYKTRRTYISCCENNLSQTVLSNLLQDFLPPVLHTPHACLHLMLNAQTKKPVAFDEYFVHGTISRSLRLLDDDAGIPIQSFGFLHQSSSVLGNAHIIAHNDIKCIILKHSGNTPYLFQFLHKRLVALRHHHIVFVLHSQ